MFILFFDILVVNDPKRITTVVNDKHSTKTIVVASEKNRQMINDNYHPNPSASTRNVPIVATVATTSLIAAGGVVGVGRPSDISQRQTTDDIKIPSRGENKRTYEYPKNDYIGLEQNSSTYGKPASLVSATMKISSATTEVYQKNEGTADVNKKNVAERLGKVATGGNMNTNNHSIDYDVKQTQVSGLLWLSL